MKDMAQRLQKILIAVDTMVKEIARLDELAQHQAASTQKISVSMNEISVSAESIRKVSNELIQ